MIAAKRLAIAAAACLMFSATAQMQWLDYPTAGIARLSQWQAQPDRANAESV
jgi:hypothetical protein